MDDPPVIPAPSPGPDDAGDELNRLRQLALECLISENDFMRACRAVAVRRARSRLRSGSYGDEIDDVAQETLCRVISAYGPLLSQPSRGGGEPPRQVTGVLLKAVDNVVTDLFRKTRVADWQQSQERPPDGQDGPADQDKRGSGARRVLPLAPQDVAEVSKGNAGDPVAEETLGYLDARRAGQARAEARGNLERFRAIRPGAKQCPFHYGKADGCPHRAEIFGLLDELINQLDPGAAAPVEERLRELGRQLGLSTRDNTFLRDLRHCFDWWRYLAFRGTAIDLPGAAAAVIRRPLVERIAAAAKPDGRWDYVACSKQGARLIIETDPAEFRRLLLAAGRNVDEYLEGRPTDGR